jgi:hypothetical protein
MPVVSGTNIQRIARQRQLEVRQEAEKQARDVRAYDREIKEYNDEAQTSKTNLYGKCFAQHSSQKIGDGKCNIEFQGTTKIDINLHELSDIMNLPGRLQGAMVTDKDRIDLHIKIDAPHECVKLAKCMREAGF